jgi:hypothetical protein
MRRCATNQNRANSALSFFFWILLDLSLGSDYHSFHAPSPEECGKGWVETLITECGQLTRKVVHFAPRTITIDGGDVICVFRMRALLRGPGKRGARSGREADSREDGVRADMLRSTIENPGRWRL